MYDKYRKKIRKGFHNTLLSEERWKLVSSHLAAPPQHTFLIIHCTFPGLTSDLVPFLTLSLTLA